MGASPSAAVGCTLLQSCVNHLAAMGDPGQVQHVIDQTVCCLFPTNDGDTGDLAAWVELQLDGLEHTLLTPPVFEPDRKGMQSMHHGTPMPEQQACSFL
jgi:hypothetical protein